MAIDGLNQISPEQLMALSMSGNGQLTNDSSSSSSTSGDTSLAFALMLQNLMESAKKSDGTSSDSGDNKVSQKNSTGINLENLAMILNNRSNYAANNSSPVSGSADMNKIYSAVESAANKYGVDKNLILAIIKQESNFDSNSVSSAGAAGLMQLMPENLSENGVSNPFDVKENINGGTKLLKEYLNKYNNNFEMALMAYNGGPGTMQRRGVTSSDDLYKMPKETQNYVPKVMSYYENGI